MHPDIFPTISLEKVLCTYHLESECDDGCPTEDVRVAMLHVYRSADILGEFEFHMRMLVRAGEIASKSKWKMLSYLPECGEQRF